MLNPKSVLLEHGLAISKIFCYPQRNDIIDELFLDYSLTNSEEEINWNILSSANILQKKVLIVQNLMNSKKKAIIYFLKLDISSKYKRFKISHNKNLLQNEKIKNSQWLNGLFNMKYIELFNYYYNDRFPLNKLIFNNKIINISEKTKSFYYLLEKNKKIRTELINASIDVFGFGFRPFSILYAK